METITAVQLIADFLTAQSIPAKQVVCHGFGYHVRYSGTVLMFDLQGEFIGIVPETYFPQVEIDQIFEL